MKLQFYNFFMQKILINERLKTSCIDDCIWKKLNYQIYNDLRWILNISPPSSFLPSDQDHFLYFRSYRWKVTESDVQTICPFCKAIQGEVIHLDNTMLVLNWSNQKGINFPDEIISCEESSLISRKSNERNNSHMFSF